MDENQNTTQNTTPNSSDDGGIFGASMNFTNPTSSQINVTQDVSEEKHADDTKDIQNTQTPKNAFDAMLFNAQQSNDTAVNLSSDPAQQQKSIKNPLVPENQKDEDEEKELEKLGVQVVEKTPQTHNTNVFDSASAFNPQNVQKKSNMPVVETKDLEKDFSETFNTGPSVLSINSQETDDALEKEEQKLKKLHQELKNKAGEKKQKVREGLENLKKQKEILGKELQEIKEIEEVAAKIYEKIQHLEQIDTELDDIEKRAQEELSS